MSLALGLNYEVSILFIQMIITNNELFSFFLLSFAIAISIPNANAIENCTFLPLWQTIEYLQLSTNSFSLRFYETKSLNQFSPKNH